MPDEVTAPSPSACTERRALRHGAQTRLKATLDEALPVVLNRTLPGVLDRFLSAVHYEAAGRLLVNLLATTHRYVWEARLIYEACV